MDLKAGFTQNGTSSIPADWDVQPLGELLAQARLGGNYPNQGRESSYPLMKMGNLSRGHFDLDKVEYISPGTTPHPGDRLRHGDVLFNTRNTLELVGKVAMWRDELPVAFFNSNLMRLEFDADRVCSSAYANYALNSEQGIATLRALATGTTSVAAIYTRDLLRMPFVVPPPVEQKAIAGALSDVDALLGALDRLIAKKRDLKQAAMQQLLTGQTRLPGFTGKWETLRAGDVGRFRGGNGFPTNAQGSSSGEFPFFKVSDMNLAGNETEMVNANNWISNEVRQKLGATAFPTGSIVIAKVGAAVFLERKKLLVRPSCIDNNMAAFVVARDRLAPRFAHLALLNTRLGDLVSTTALPSLNGTVLARLPLQVPPPSEQAAIVAVLNDVDVELTVLEQRRDKTRLLKQGMMQELLTGKTRLV